MANIPVIAEINTLLDANDVTIAKTALGALGAVVTGGALGTPAAGSVLTNATGLPIVAGTAGTLTVERGGTNATTAATARASILPTFTNNAGKVLAVNSNANDVEYVLASGNPPFSTITGQPVDNANLKTSLDNKAPVLPEILPWTVKEAIRQRGSGLQMQYSFMALGDSWMADLGIADPLVGRIGELGQLERAQRATLAGGAVFSGQHTKYSAGSPSGDTVILTAAGHTMTVAGEVGGRFFPATKASVLYKQQAMAGSFKVEVQNRAGNFVEVSGSTTNTTGTDGVVGVDFDFTVIDGKYIGFSTQVRIVWVSGTVEIIALGVCMNASNVSSNANRAGVISYNAGQIASTAEQYASIPQYAWNGILPYLKTSMFVLHEFREVQYSTDQWLAYIQTLMTRVQTGRKYGTFAKMVYTYGSNTITATAVTSGISGESIRIKYISAGNNQNLTVNVSGNDITVNLATSSTGLGTSTTAEIMSAVAASAAAALVTITTNQNNFVVPAFTDFQPLSCDVGVDFIMVGSHPVGAAYSHVAASDTALQNFCIANRIHFVDLRKRFPSYEATAQLGYLDRDGLHMSFNGGLYKSQQIWDSCKLEETWRSYKYNSNGQYPQFMGSGVQRTWRVNYNPISVAGVIALSRLDGGPNTIDTWSVTGTTTTNNGQMNEGIFEKLYDFKIRQIDQDGRTVMGQNDTLTRVPSASLEVGTSGTFATTRTSLIVGAIAGLTVNAVEIRTGVSNSSAGTLVSGFTKHGIPFVASHTTGTRDALTGVYAGSIILNTTTSKLNFYTGSAWEAVTSS